MNFILFFSQREGSTGGAKRGPKPKKQKLEVGKFYIANVIFHRITYLAAITILTLLNDLLALIILLTQNDIQNQEVFIVYTFYVNLI